MMGEVAESLIDGTCCQGCGVFIGEGEGFPRTCDSCNDDGKRGKAERRAVASDQFAEASRVASANGMTLLKRSDQHYTLRATRWALEIYPGNGRLFRPKPTKSYPERAPYIKVDYGWTLLDVVGAVPTMEET